MQSKQSYPDAYSSEYILSTTIPSVLPEMRAVIQRVLHASVVVDGVTISSIGKGLMVLIGIGIDDTPADTALIIKKLINLRLFEKDDTMWKSSVKDINGEILCVSQFTLLARIDKGSKPDFHGAMATAPGKALYTDFLQELGKAYDPTKIKDGEFGAMMQVSLCNDGPVTITYDTKTPKSSSSTSTPVPSGTSTPLEAISPLSEEAIKEKTRLKREAKVNAAMAFKEKQLMIKTVDVVNQVSDTLATTELQSK